LVTPTKRDKFRSGERADLQTQEITVQYQDREPEMEEDAVVRNCSKAVQYTHINVGSELGAQDLVRDKVALKTLIRLRLPVRFNDAIGDTRSARALA